MSKYIDLDQAYVEGGGSGSTTFSGDLTGTSTGPQTVVAIRNKPVSAVAPISGQVLQFDGTSYVPTTPSGGGGAPATASYLTLGLDAGLSNERVLTAGTNISFADTGANGTLTINSTYTPTDATTSLKGILQLAGDLGGTAALPSVLKINGIAVSGTPAIGNTLIATSTSAATWQAPATPADASTSSKGIIQLAGDMGGTAAAPLNLKVNSVSYPAGGALTTGSIPIVSGVSAVSYGSLNLSLAATVGSSILASANMFQATTTVSGAIKLANDLGGTAALPTVIRVNGATVPAAGGALVTGNSLYASGTSTLTYSALNLAGGAGWVSGLLPAANQASQTLSGDLSGTTSAATVIKLQSVAVSATAPTTNQVLQYNGTTWLPATLATGSFTAGGDLAGTSTSQTVKSATGNAGVFTITAATVDKNATSKVRTLEYDIPALQKINDATPTTLYTLAITTNSNTKFTAEINCIQSTGAVVASWDISGTINGTGTMTVAGAIRVYADNTQNASILCSASLVGSNVVFTITSLASGSFSFNGVLRTVVSTY